MPIEHGVWRDDPSFQVIATELPLAQPQSRNLQYAEHSGSTVEDDRRREERSRLIAEDAVAMGFDPELVASVQAQRNYNSVGGLVEKLVELTREHVEPEPEREDEHAGAPAAIPEHMTADLPPGRAEIDFAGARLGSGSFADVRSGTYRFPEIGRAHV